MFGLISGLRYCLSCSVKVLSQRVDNVMRMLGQDVSTLLYSNMWMISYDLEILTLNNGQQVAECLASNRKVVCSPCRLGYLNRLSRCSWARLLPWFAPGATYYYGWPCKTTHFTAPIRCRVPSESIHTPWLITHFDVLQPEFKMD
jgi:hypothetical protein